MLLLLLLLGVTVRRSLLLLSGGRRRGEGSAFSDSFATLPGVADKAGVGDELYWAREETGESVVDLPRFEAQRKGERWTRKEESRRTCSASTPCWILLMMLATTVL